MSTTPAAEWRKNRETGIELTLPSGNTARIRAVSTDWFIKIGRIPDFLTPLVVKSLEQGGLKQEDMPKPEAIKDTKEWIELLDSFCEMAFVEPQVVPEVLPGGNQITPDDLSYADKYFVFTFVGRPVKFLEFFRQKQEEYVGRVAAQPDVQPAAKPDTETQDAV